MLGKKILQDSKNLMMVKEESRLDFLPSRFGRHFFSVENLMFSTAKRLISEYDGGLWDFYDAIIPDPDGGILESAPVMIWDYDEEVTLHSQYKDETLSAFSASLAISILIYNQLAFYCYEKGDEKNMNMFNQYFYTLKNWMYMDEQDILTHNEREMIFDFLD